MTITRPDSSAFLAHFTSRKYPKGFKDPSNPTNKFMYQPASKRFENILKEKRIYASQLPWVGSQKAVCFTECPWTSLIRHTEEYSPYGIGFTKEFIFNKGGGPVYYVRADVFNSQNWDEHLLPFVTPFWPQYSQDKSPLGKPVDYSHEREWRVLQDLVFDYEDIQFIILPDYKEMAKFPKELKDSIGREKFLLLENYKKIEELWPVHKVFID